MQSRGVRRPSVCPSVRPSVNISQIAILLADKWLDRHQTCTRWSPDGSASSIIIIIIMHSNSSKLIFGDRPNLKLLRKIGIYDSQTKTESSSSSNSCSSSRHSVVVVRNSAANCNVRCVCLTLQHKFCNSFTRINFSFSSFFIIY